MKSFMVALLAIAGSQAQINFGGPTNTGVGPRPAFEGGNNDGNDDGQQNLADILGESPDGIFTRFNDGVNARIQGESCITPRGNDGVCSYISEPQCSGTVGRIRRRGVTRRILRYLRRAIRSPCGFDRFDYTLCCSEDEFGGGGGGRPSTTTRRPTTTRRTTTTTTTTTTPDPSTCGVSPFRLRIVGGSEAPVGAWPWAGILGQPSGGSNSFVVVCGATLVSPRHLISAAHCFPDNGSNRRITHVRLGEHDISKTSDDARGTPLDVPVARVAVHEGYSNVSLKNDIAVITLRRAVTFNARISPVCMPDALRNTNNLERRFSSMNVIGWGATVNGGRTVNALMQAEVPLVGSQECDRAYASVQRIRIGRRDQICAGRGLIDACSGDSGGGLLVEAGRNAAWTLAGVTSFGAECGSETMPGVYTRVDNFLPWIRRQMRR